MKNFIEKYTPYLLAVIVGCLITTMFYRVKEDLKQPKESDMLVLGGAGSINYAKPEDVDVEDVKLGMVKKDSEGCIYYDTIPKLIHSKPYGDFITKLHKNVIECDTLKVKVLEISGCITRRGKVSEINKKDINPEPPMHSIIHGRRVVYNDSIYYYFNDVNNKHAN